MALNLHTAIGWSWYGLAAVWIATLAFTKRTVRSQSGPSRLFQVSLVLLSFTLLAGSSFQSGWLAVRVLPDNPLLAWIGFALTIFGCLWAVWARLVLGANWSGQATVKAGHELVVSGPYALTRHPIYSGILLAAMGTATSVGEVRCLMGLGLLAICFAVKIGQEERLMIETFADSYRIYRTQVRALIPGIF